MILSPSSSSSIERWQRRNHQENRSMDQDQWSKIIWIMVHQKEPMNLLWARIHRFLWYTMIQVILNERSWYKSSHKNTPSINSYTCYTTTLQQLQVYFFCIFFNCPIVVHVVSIIIIITITIILMIIIIIIIIIITTSRRNNHQICKENQTNSRK